MPKPAHTPGAWNFGCTRPLASLQCQDGSDLSNSSKEARARYPRVPRLGSDFKYSNALSCSSSPQHEAHRGLRNQDPPAQTSLQRDMDLSHPRAGSALSRRPRLPVSCGCPQHTLRLQVLEQLDLTSPRWSSLTGAQCRWQDRCPCSMQGPHAPQALPGLLPFRHGSLSRCPSCEMGRGCGLQPASAERASPACCTPRRPCCSALLRQAACTAPQHACYLCCWYGTCGWSSFRTAPKMAREKG